jgi:hypothetical protein
MDPSVVSTGTSDYRARCVSSSILHVRCTASLGFLSDDTAWIRVDLEPPAAISRASVHGIGTTRRASRTPLQQEIKTSSWYSTACPRAVCLNPAPLISAVKKYILVYCQLPRSFPGDTCRKRGAHNSKGNNSHLDLEALVKFLSKHHKTRRI